MVRATTTTMKGNFPGLGMASAERDHSIAPAILELAETQGIAGSLKFDGVFTFHWQKQAFLLSWEGFFYRIRLQLGRSPGGMRSVAFRCLDQPDS